MMLAVLREGYAENSMYAWPNLSGVKFALVLSERDEWQP
jgi:hypothetical protein